MGLKQGEGKREGVEAKGIEARREEETRGTGGEGD